MKEIIERTRSTSTAALPWKNYKSRYKQTHKNSAERINKCKGAREKKKILPFISTFNPSNLKTLPISKQTLENLKISDWMRNAFKRSNLLTASYKDQA